MSKLFKKIPALEKKSVRIEILVSQKDADEIRFSALIRNLTVAEYIRRASLSRRADVKFDTLTILSLHDVVQSIRRLHATFSAQSIPIPLNELGVVIDEALAAMMRISK